MPLIRLLLCGVLAGLLSGAGPARGGLTPFSDPGKIDFDTAMELLNPYGTWAQVDGQWAFTPLVRGTPYTHGRWLYTEYGWYWQGTAPESWVTEHYGYWKRNADKVWIWYPGPFWLPQTVEIRASTDGIGWRSAEVDRDGNFVEPPAVRFTKTDEWTFVTPAQFAAPITPAVVATPAVAEQLLEESTDSVHSYLTYREIDRPGPHPADFINLGDGGMFAPMTAAERARALRPIAKAKPAPPEKTTPAAAPGTLTAQARASAEAARIAASLTASETAPEIPQQPGADDPNDDPRQVKYWVTMSLPTPTTPIPPDATRDQIYLYRPDFYQDDDGIQRRITFWLNPSLRSSEALHLQDVLGHRPGVAAAKGAAVPATEAEAIPAAPARDFSSPFEESFQGNAGTKHPAAAANASPLFSAGAPTNAAPAAPVPAPAGRAQN